MENTENYEEIKAEEFLRRLYLAATCEKEIIIRSIVLNENITIDISYLRGKIIIFKSGKFNFVAITGSSDEDIDIKIPVNGKLLNLVQFKIEGGSFKYFSIQTKNIGKFQIEGYN